MASKVIGVRFAKVGKIYFFDTGAVEDLQLGDQVVVETSRGWQLGMIAQIPDPASVPDDPSRKTINRKATPRDLLQRQSWQRQEADVVTASKTRARELRLQDVKIVSAEYSFDGARLTILYSSESEDKVDLNSLRQDIQKMYAPAQVDIRQIGPRDAAKIIGGMGACGMEIRCCSLFLTDFCSISIRMAKEQNISLTPNEITGMCGRLRCCLIYEYQQYVEARAELPKRNKRVITPQGEGKVIDVEVLRQMIRVEIPEVGIREFHKDEVEPADELERLQKKMHNPSPTDPSRNPQTREGDITEH